MCRPDTLYAILNVVAGARHASIGELAEISYYNERTVRRAIAKLRETHHLAVQEEWRRGQQYHYTLLSGGDGGAQRD